MKLTTRRTVTAGALAAVLAIGGTGIALAGANAAPAPGGSDTTGTQQQDQEQDPSYTGSMPAPPDGNETDTGPETTDSDAAEADEAKALESLATVTPEEATAAALAAEPGTASATELDNENGYVVYSVEVTRADGTTVDVKIDAGDATVLAQETDDDTEANDD